ncbi:hypothetical protein PUW24_15170 [Paenibacillus urinalis]|uniref:Uncharacterized protein n=1 Tax=Paenibacillus urinalis TaxID=521520 RepID=A0AAX3N2X6_9BACL|nr:hypothetical protein [Paenibacillus urinalis]WDH84110.1 hypothetical protein PUW23_07815 [Paenibacillus urinalis]WDH95553.1 hypothetical protein PUW24_15170 [Paenibacillus urinalis]WDI03750.1 hypothetical protein PUW25_07290 [Paenibacillus urinalis]
MKKWIYMLLLLVTLFLFLWDWIDRPRPFDDAAMVSKLTEAQAGDRIELEELTPFSWEELYIFGPYLDPSSIDVRNMDEVPDGIQYLDSMTLLVFVRNNTAIRYIELPRSAGDFETGLYEQAIKQKNAVFIQNEDSKLWKLDD